MRSNIVTPVVALILIVLTFSTQAQVGIGTSTPNTNAVLELKSPGNNQGFLVPRLTTAQRTGMSLTTSENGLLVFDSEENKFYYWQNSAWFAIDAPQDLSLTGNTLVITGNSNATPIDLAPFAGVNTDNQTLSATGTGNTRNLTISGGNSITLNVADNDSNNTNEIQDLTLTANTLALSGDATTVNLAPYLDNTDSQTLSATGTGDTRNVTISGGNTLALNVADNDSDATNEIQTISKTGTTVTLSGGGGSFTDAVDDADASPTNELQTLSLAGVNLTLSNGGGTVSLPTGTTYTAGTGIGIAGSVISNTGDLSNTNELQTVSKAGNTVTLSNSGGSFTVDDADASTTNELQTISKTGTTVTLSGGGGSFTDAVDDADASPTNELQTVSKAGNTVTLSNGGGSFTVDDADASTTNELQTISKTGTTVTLSNGGGSFTVDDADASATNEIQDLSVTSTTTNRTINISGGGTSATFSVADNDNSTTNEIQALSLVGSTLSLSNGGGSVTLPGGSGISGSGSSGQVTYWSGASSVTGNSNFVYDDKLPGLGVNIKPLAGLHVEGSQAVTVQITTDNDHIVKDRDYVIIAPATTNVVTLPDAAKVVGRVLIIRSVDPKGVTIRSEDSKDTIDGNETMNIFDSDAQVNSVILISAGDDRWVAISKSRK